MCETSNRPARSARVQMLLQDAQRILHRHLVAGERHHLGAKRDVQLVERRAFQGLSAAGAALISLSSPIGLHPAPAGTSSSPLCHGT